MPRRIPDYPDYLCYINTWCSIVQLVVYTPQKKLINNPVSEMITPSTMVLIILASEYYSYLTTAWMSGLVLYLLTIATAFLGYVLPWGQMSFWGATVITNLLSPIPYLVPWLLGGYYVSDVTLKRFFVLHFILPFIGCIIIVLHIFYLHLNGSSNPAGIDTALKVAFYPHMLMTDAKCLSYLIGLIFLQAAFGLMELSHPDNSIPVNRFVTPLHIVPEWYF
ncbi:cytochrome b/b6/petB subfamily protein [Toxoplasma gondii]|uniref:Cytochrome b n=2 Tax=Toxoplasma gondii TaxID=5811 RepID=A0A7J6KI05_TOXGO|nr:cytochrome b/b6/petB subfamily protein [Toxoplasma gondii]